MSQYPALILSRSGLVSYWRANQTSGTTAADQLVLNPGAYTGGYTLGQAGALAGDSDTAVLLDGSTGYINVPSSPSLNTASITVECWVNPAVLAQQQFVGKGTWWLQMANDVNFTWGGQGNAIHGGSNVPTNQWSHVVGTYDTASGIAYTYLNGVQQAQGSLPQNPSLTDTTALVIGTWSLSIGANNLQGKIDEIAIYNYALSPNEVMIDFVTGSTLPFGHTSLPKTLGPRAVGPTFFASPQPLSSPPPVFPSPAPPWPAPQLLPRRLGPTAVGPTFFAPSHPLSSPPPTFPAPPLPQPAPQFLPQRLGPKAVGPTFFAHKQPLSPYPPSPLPIVPDQPVTKQLPPSLGPKAVGPIYFVSQKYIATPQDPIWIAVV